MAEIDDKFESTIKKLEDMGESLSKLSRIQKEAATKTLEELKKKAEQAKIEYEDNIKLGTSKHKLNKALTQYEKAMIAVNKEVRTQEKSIKDITKSESDLDEKRKKVADVSVKVMQELSSSIKTAVSSVYGANDAFSAAGQTLEGTVNIVKQLISAIGSMASGASAFGFSLGNLPEGVGKVVNASIDFSNTIVQQQLKFATDFTASMKTVSESGVTFGGNMDRLANAAQLSGTTIAGFTKFIQNGIESLSAFGGDLVSNAKKFTQLGRSIGDTNSGLLLTYGSYEALNEEILAYADSQRRLGLSETEINKNLKTSTEDYLRRQQELSQLTGKRANELKKEEEERRRRAAYQLSLSKMGETERQNTQAAISIIRAQLGDTAASAAEELTATGELRSRAGMEFQAYFGEQASYIRQLLGATKGTENEFKNDMGRIGRESAEAIKLESIKIAESVGQLVYASQNSVIQNLSKGASEGLGVSERILKLQEQVASINQQNAQNSGVTSELAAKSIRELRDLQIEIDGTVKNSVKNISGLVSSMNGIQRALIFLGDAAADFISLIASGETDPEKLKQKATELNEKRKKAMSEQIPTLKSTTENKSETASIPQSEKNLTSVKRQEIRDSALVRWWKNRNKNENTPKTPTQSTAKSPSTPKTPTQSTAKSPSTPKTPTQSTAKSPSKEEPPQKTKPETPTSIEQSKESIPKTSQTHLVDPILVSKLDESVRIQRELLTITKESNDYLKKIKSSSV